MSLTLDYPYNKSIADKLSKYQYTWEPYATSNIKGMKGGSMYALPGSSAAYPMLDMVEQEMVDRGQKTKRQVLKKGGMAKIKTPDQSKGENKVINAIESVLKSDNPGMKGGAFGIIEKIEKIDFNKIKKKVTPILKGLVSVGLDVGMPALGAAVSTAFSANPAIGTFVGKLAREVLRAKTGIGRKNKDVGIYEGGSLVNLATGAVIGKVAREAVRSRKGKGKCSNPKPRPEPKSGTGHRNARNLLVKKVMKDKGMSLPQASKYIKENNMY
jgi:hypothetical protein